jgi:hypothetical protein
MRAGGPSGTAGRWGAGSRPVWGRVVVAARVSGRGFTDKEAAQENAQEEAQEDAEGDPLATTGRKVVLHP